MGHPDNPQKQPPGKARIIPILSQISGKVLFLGVFEIMTFFRMGAWIWTEGIEMDENGIQHNKSHTM